MHVGKTQVMQYSFVSSFESALDRSAILGPPGQDLDLTQLFSSRALFAKAPNTVGGTFSALRPFCRLFRVQFYPTPSTCPLSVRGCVPPGSVFIDLHATLGSLVRCCSPVFSKGTPSGRGRSRGRIRFFERHRSLTYGSCLACSTSSTCLVIARSRRGTEGWDSQGS